MYNKKYKFQKKIENLEVPFVTPFVSLRKDLMIPYARSVLFVIFIYCLNSFTTILSPGKMR